MLRGLYAAATALRISSLRHEAAAANATNVYTPGYRARHVALAPFARLLVHRLAAGGVTPLGALDYGVAVAERVLDTAPGPLQETGRPLDVALLGDGFLVVATPAGERYTRDGRLQVASDGRLVDVAGRPVLGEGGPIRVAPGAAPTVEPDGTVRVGEQAVGRLRVVRFTRPDLLQPTPDGLYAATPASGPALPDAETRLQAGFLERANVDLARETVELMAALRAFEAAQRAIRAQDETLGLATSELARF